MNWEERIRQSDAGKLMPERAEEIVAAAKRKEEVRPNFSWPGATIMRDGKEWPTRKKVDTPSRDELEPAVLKGEFS